MFRIEHEQPAVRPHRDHGHIMVVHLTDGGKERWGKTAGCVVVGPDPDVALAVKPADKGLGSYVPGNAQRSKPWTTTTLRVKKMLSPHFRTLESPQVTRPSPLVYTFLDQLLTSSCAWFGLPQSLPHPWAHPTGQSANKDKVLDLQCDALALF